MSQLYNGDISISLLIAHREYSLGCWLENTRFYFTPRKVGTKNRTPDDPICYSQRAHFMLSYHGS